MAGNTAGSIVIDIVAKTGELQTDIDRANSSIQKLQRDLQKFAKETAASGKEFERNFVGPLRDGENAINRFSATAARGSEGIARLGKGMQQNQGAFRTSNQIIQNTSYQLTDFIVQVQGGVSAMRAFSQQAPQFLGAFGPTGAALGIFAALGGAFAPMIIEAVKGSAAIKSFDDALKASEDALGSVATAGRTFDMTPVIKQFNDADAATRQSIIQLMSYKKALVEITNIDLRKAFSEQVAGLTDSGFFSQFTNAMPSEQFASTMGIAVNKQMYADLRVLRYEYGSVQEFADKYATTLAKGNEEGRKFAKTIVEMARSLKEGELATKAINEAQGKMQLAGPTGRIQTDKEADKESKLLQKMFENQRVGADKFIESMQRSNEQVQFQTSLLGRNAQEVEVLNAQYKIQAELQKTIQDIERQNGTIRAEELQKMTAAAEAAIAIQTAAITSRQEMERSASYGMTRSMEDYFNNATNMAKNVEGVFKSAFDGMSNAIVDFAMNGKNSFGDFARSVISQIMKIYVTMALIGLAKNAASAFAGMASSSSSTGFEWNAAGEMIPTGSGYAEGGYTGDGGKYQPAGIVHAGEFVMTKEATNRIGVGNLYRMMRGYADGGLVGSSMPSGGMGGNININVKNEAGADGYQATATARKNDTGIDIDIMVRKAVNSDLQRNGPISQQISSTYNLRRQS